MTSSRPKTTTFASGVRGLTALVFALAAAPVGCGTECPAGSTAMSVTAVECASQGSVQVASATLALPATAVPGGGAITCMQTDGTCGGDAVIAFATPGEIRPSFIHFGFRIPGGEGPRRYGLTADTTLFTSALVSDEASAYTGNLAVTSGALVVGRNDARNLDATFFVELETTDGLHRVSLTNGEIHVNSCAVVASEQCFVAD